MPNEKLLVAVVETASKVAVAAVAPYGGSLVMVWEAVRNQFTSRVQLTAENVADAVGIDRLAERLSESPEFEALFVNALDSAARTGYEPKRRLLARVVINAALDDSVIDESWLIEQALRDLDAPHLRALERIRLAVDSLPPDSPNRARSKAAVTAGALEPESVRAVLVRTGVAAAPMFPGGGIGIAYVSQFGRDILESLHRLAEETQAT